MPLRQIRKEEKNHFPHFSESTIALVPSIHGAERRSRLLYWLFTKKRLRAARLHAKRKTTSWLLVLPFLQFKKEKKKNTHREWAWHA